MCFIRSYQKKINNKMNTNPYYKEIKKFSTNNLALLIGVTPITIWRWRNRGMPSKKYKHTEKGCYYLIDDVLDWMKCQPKLMELYIQVRIKLDE